MVMGLEDDSLKDSAATQRKSLIFWRCLLGLIISLFFLLHAPFAIGQNQPISAWVNTTTVSTDELVVLTVKVIDDSAQQPRPLLPRLDGLAVVDLDIATDVDLVDGQIQTEVIYTYRLQPRRTGLLTIPPVAVKIDDQTFKTPPISIEVAQGAAPAPSPDNAVVPEDVSPPADFAGDDFFIESLVDLPNPYLGQQLIHTFRFYQALQVYRQPQYEEPLFKEFETMGLPVREYNLDAAGRTYLVSEIRMALFPATTGNITIGPARLMLPGNIYEEPVDLYTEPIEVQVKPLPGNAPPGFNGAVGQYEIEAWFDPAEVVVNQPATLFVAVSGTGNVQELPELMWPELDGWQAYNSLTSLTTAMENNLMTGTRVYERVMVPAEIGDHTIPPISLVFFDPVAGQYRTISTAPLSARVIPAPTPDPSAPVAVLPTAGPPDGVVAAVAEPTETGSVGVSAWWELWELARTILTSMAKGLFVGLCGVIPAVVLLGLGGKWVWRRRQQLFEMLESEQSQPPPPSPQSEPDPPLEQPSQTIHPALVLAMKHDANNYKAVSQALHTYLGHMLHSSINGLTRSELAARLRERELNETTIKRIATCLDQSEMGRFGPVSDDAGWSLMVETDALLFDLDKMCDTEV